MPDQRYAPPGAAVKDVAHERLLAQRPVQVQVAVIALWTMMAVPGVPIVWHEYNQASALAPGAGLFVIVVSAVMFSIAALLTWFVGRGRNWARICYLLFMLLSLGAYIFSFDQLLKEPLWVLAGNLLSTLVDLLALALLFFGPSARWFRQMRE